MKKSIYRIFIILFLVLVSNKVLAANINVNKNLTGCVTGVGQPDPYSVVYCSIQDAINDSAVLDTVIVEAGIYNTADEVFPITIDKQITLLGKNPNIDPRPYIAGRSGAETILDAEETSVSVIRISSADSVSINGFSITGGTGDMVEEVGHADNLYFGYNILYDGLSTAGDEGIQIDGSDGVRIEYNYFYNIVQDAINLSDASDGYIEHNELSNIGTVNATIYCYDTDDISISNNIIFSVPNGDGIKLGDIGDSSDEGSINNNLIYNVAEDGIVVHATNIEVNNNEIYNVSGEDGAIYIAQGDNCSVTDNIISNNTAIGVLVSNTDSVEIEYNDIFNNNDSDDTKYPGSAGIWVTSDSSNIAVHYNNIYSNTDYGLRNDSTIALDAENNYWGSIDGPTNIGGSGDNVLNAITCPYLDDYYPSGEPTGTVINWDTNKIFCELQTAIDDTETLDGHTIEILPGVYDEQVVINKELTIIGDDKTTTIIDHNDKSGSGGVCVSIESDNVYLINFAVQECNIGIEVNNDIANLNLIGVNSLDNYSYGFYTNNQIDGLIISNSGFSSNNGLSYARGLMIQNSNGVYNNVSIIGSEFSDNGLVGIDLNLNSALNNVNIEDNTVDNNGDAGISVFFGADTGPDTKVFIDSNTIEMTDNQRFGIEIKNPIGSAGEVMMSTGSFIVSNNEIEQTGTVTLTNDRDFAGLAVIQRTDGYAALSPEGVVIRDNTINNVSANNNGEGFGVVVSGTKMKVISNTIDGCDIGIQTQKGNPSGSSSGSAQGDGTDFFDRDNGAYSCAYVSNNIFGTNNINKRYVDTTGTYLSIDDPKIDNITTTAKYCSIQNAVDDANANNIIEVKEGIYEENIVIDTPLTLRGVSYQTEKTGVAVPGSYTWTGETVLEPMDKDSIVLEIRSDDVSLEGFVINVFDRDTTEPLLYINGTTGAANDGDTVEPSLNNIIVRNNVLGPNTGTAGGDSIKISTPYTIGSETGLTDSEITGNKIFEAEGDGILIEGASETSPSSSDYLSTFVDNNEIYNNAGNGIKIEGGIRGLSITDNDIKYNGSAPDIQYGHGIVLVRALSDILSLAGSGSEDISIDSNNIHDNSTNGIYMGPMNKGIEITDNQISANTASGILIDLNESFHTGAVSVIDYLSGIEIKRNTINNGDGLELIGIPVNEISAEENYWGDITGPGGDGPGIGDTIQGSIDFVPWADDSFNLIYPRLAYSKKGFAESNENDGSIKNTDPLRIYINNGRFTGLNGSDFVADNKVSITNFGTTGLTESDFSFTKMSDTELQVMITGKAVSHEPENNIDDLTFEFNDNAFYHLPSDEVLNKKEGGFLIYFSDTGNQNSGNSKPTGGVGGYKETCNYDLPIKLSKDILDLGYCSIDLSSNGVITKQTSIKNKGGDIKVIFSVGAEVKTLDERSYTGRLGKISTSVLLKDSKLNNLLYKAFYIDASEDKIDFSIPVEVEIDTDTDTEYFMYVYNEDKNRYEFMDTGKSRNGVLKYSIDKPFSKTSQFVVLNSRIEDNGPEESICDDVPFKDIDGHWARCYIYDAWQREIIKGKTKTVFEPDTPITRAEFVKIVVEGFSIKGTDKEEGFTDVYGWSSPYIYAAKEAGIIEGYKDKTFRPNQLITRAEASKIISLASGIEITSGKNRFIDIKSDAWYSDFVLVLSDIGIVKGYKDQTFRPKNYITRAESVKIVMMLLEYIK